MSELSTQTKNLINQYIIWQNSLKPKEGVSTIHVDEVASRVAAFYEQIRTVVDWQEEHLMKRSAIIRKLKRRFAGIEINDATQTFEGNQTAESLIMELIRGGHFPNDFIEESKIQTVQNIINKYIFILKNNPENKNGKAGLQFFNWVIEVMSCEIEESLTPAIRENALIEYMFELMKERIKVSSRVFGIGVLKENETNILIYIATQQALFKFDKPIISYNLIKYEYSNWRTADQKTLLEIYQNIYKIWREVERYLSHPLLKKFYTICEKYDTPYLLLGDILSEQNLETINDKVSSPEKFEELVRSAYKKRLKTLKSRLHRAAVYSTVSIFVTKILSLLVLEVVISELFTGNLNYILLGADILIPTILMLLLVSTVRPPSQKNLNIVTMEAMKIVYQKEKIDSYEIKAPKEKGLFGKLVVSLFYLIGACISYGFIFWVLYYFKFPIASIVINIIFIALILFTGIAIRKRSRELSVEDENEGFLSFFADILILPVASLGRWISIKWKQYNAFTAFFNALIDMPFSIFVEFIERWRYFIKEKKEEIR